MRRLLIALAAAAAIPAALAYSDTHYSIDFPEGWVVDPPTAEGLVAAKPPGTTDGANCNSQYVPRAEMAAYTQEQINAEFSKPLPPEAWASFVGLQASDVKASDGEAIDIGGKYLQIATLEITAESQIIIVRIGLVAMPGQIITAGCYAKTEVLDTYKAMYDTTIKSLKPL